MEDYPLPGYCAELEHLILNAGREQEKGGEGLATHYDEYLYLPFTLDDYKGRYLHSPGREGLPLHLEPLSPEIGSSLIKLLIRELNDNMVSNLDINPNFSRSAKPPEMHCALREGRVDKALFIGGSNASKLASATAMLRVDTFKIPKGGWKVTSDLVDLLHPDLEEQLSGMPHDTPIVLYRMDNSAFMSVSSDGSMAPLAKATGGEGGYHAIGELIIAPDRALVNPINNLKRVIEACGDYPVFVISPHFRFVKGPCCYAAGHMPNFGDPGFIREMVKDLSRIFQLLKNVKIVEGMELICGKKYNLEKAMAAATTYWAADTIHPTSHTYAKMALHLLDAIAPQETPWRGGGGGTFSTTGTTATAAASALTASVSLNRGSTIVKRSAPGTGQNNGETNFSRVRNSIAVKGTPPHPPPRGLGNYTGRGGGGGEDRSYPTYGVGRRPYNRGWVPRGKRRN
jgi:hypothetical protein